MILYIYIMIFIYTLCCPLTDETRYVGKTKSERARYSNHLSDKSKCHKASWIKSLKAKGLKPTYYVIDECEEKDWVWLEQYWIAQFKAWGFNLTNHTIGGEGASGCTMPEEQKAKISASIKKTIQKNGSWLTGKKQSESTKKKRSKSLMGRKNTWQKGKTLSNKTINKMSVAMTGEKNPHAKLTGKIVKKIKLLLRQGELSQRGIARHLNIKPHYIFNIAQNRVWKHIKI